jgi:hypothetical protein
MTAEDTLARGSSQTPASTVSLATSPGARKPMRSKAGRRQSRAENDTAEPPIANGAAAAIVDVGAADVGAANVDTTDPETAGTHAAGPAATGGEKLHAGRGPGEVGSNDAVRQDLDAGRSNRDLSRGDVSPATIAGHERDQYQGHPPDDSRHDGVHSQLSHLEWEPPRIALYEDTRRPPLVVSVTEARFPELAEAVTARVHDLAKEQGGRLPYPVLRELIDNLIHASFQGVVVTILDRGNTIRISDRGPGIPDKDAALQPGFTSADAEAKLYIRGVGSGFSLVRDALEDMDGALKIENNLGRGTVVTIRVPPSPEKVLASTPVATYNLPERQLKTLLLTVELAPVGPTRIAEELGVSTSTAYRDLVALEQEGFVASRATGHRTVTDAGLAYLDAVL